MNPKVILIVIAVLASTALEIGGEEEDTIKGFRNLAIVLLISVVSIFVLDLKLVKWEKVESTDYTDFTERVSA